MRTNKELFRYFFLAVFGFLIYQTLRIFSVFFIPIMVAVILVMIFYPLYRWFLKFVRSTNAAASMCTLAVILITIVPILALGVIVVRESAELYPATKEWVEKTLGNDQGISSRLPEPYREKWHKMREGLGLSGFNARDYLLERIRDSSQHLATLGAHAVKNTAFFFFDILVLIFTLFFLFRDGKKMMEWLIELIPMEKEHKRHIQETLFRTSTAVIRGVFITAGIQGFLAGVGFVIAGIKFPILFGFLTAFLAIFPIGGAAAVWVPAAGYLLLQGETLQGIFLIVWGTLFVSLVDNFLKPVLIGSKAKLPLLLLFFGILGGLRLYGFAGILLGPLLMACILAFVQMYREAYMGG